jgi:hypothetical protein
MYKSVPIIKTVVQTKHAFHFELEMHSKFAKDLPRAMTKNTRLTNSQGLPRSSTLFWILKVFS